MTESSIRGPALGTRLLPPPPAHLSAAREPASARSVPWGRLLRVPRLVLGDAAAAVVALLIVSTGPGLGTWPAAWVVLLAASRAYEHSLLTHRARPRHVLTAGLAVPVLWSAGAPLGVLPDPRGDVLALVAVTAVATLAHRSADAAVTRWWRHHGRGARRRVVVAGHRSSVIRVVDELRAPALGLDVAGVCIHGDGSDDLDVPVTVGLDRLAEAVRESDADAVVAVPCTHLEPVALRRLSWELEGTGAELLVLPGLIDVAPTRTTVGALGSLGVLHVRRADLRGWRRWAKGCWERAVAMVALVLLAPVLGALAIAVRLESSGPAVFRQQRIGRGGGTFTMYKLRTMTAQPEVSRTELAAMNRADGPLFKIADDPRVTRLGRVLRKSSLDELPQLANVVLGQMALVGPRPALPEEVARYAPDERRRLVVKPGVTGLWQVSGRSDLSWEETVRLDLRYVDNWSLGLDALIVLRTVRAVVGHRGAY